MKKKKIIVIILLLGLLALFTMTIKVGAMMKAGDDLGCGSLSNCKGAASCNGPGLPVGCSISCEDGSNINCPEVN